MNEEVSAGFIVFKIKDDEIFYLLLRHPTHWSFPKGHIEASETPLDAALRELKEETGITRQDIEIIPGFEDSTSYVFFKNGEPVSKKNIYFLARLIKDVPIRLSREHLKYDWFKYRTAERAIGFPNMIEVLRRAHQWITRLQKKNSFH